MIEISPGEDHPRLTQINACLAAGSDYEFHFE